MVNGCAVESWSTYSECVENDIFVGGKDFPGIGISLVGTECGSNKKFYIQISSC